MMIPDVRLGKDRLVRILTDRTALPLLAEEMAALLRAPPYAFVVTGLAPSGKGDLTLRLARGLMELPPSKPGRSRRKPARLSFTRIRINPKSAARCDAVTRHSRTNQALPLHSDSSYDPDPHELVVFQVVRADPQGGESQVAPYESVLSTLDDETQTILSRPRFPFGRNRWPILRRWHGSMKIRYYRHQIDKSCLWEKPLAKEEVAALERLDGVLARPEVSIHREIRSGEILFLNNTKVLHGRTAFPADSRRLLYRIRVHAGCLA